MEKQKQPHRRPYYAGYTDHMLNFYISTLKGPQTRQEASSVDFRSDVDELNWRVCNAVYGRLSASERDLVYAIHSAKQELRHDVVIGIAYQKQVPVADLWRTDHQVQYCIAVERGLIAPLR